MEKGIVLKSIDYKDSSKIVTLYTISGKKQVLIKGAKKINSKFRSFSLLFNVINYYATDTNLPVLIDGDIVKTYSSICNDYRRSIYASIVLEMISKLYEEPNEKLFNFIVKILDKIDSDNYELYTLIFMVKYLYFLGIAPQFRCSCKEMKRVKGFSIANGTIVCEGCNLDYDLNLEETIVLSNLYTIDIQNEKINLSSDMIKEMTIKILKYYEYHVGFICNTKKYIK